MAWYASVMKYITHENALQYWNIQSMTNCFDERIAQSTRTKYLVLKKKGQASSKDVEYIICTRELPDGALDHVRRVVSPQFMYLQLAKGFDLFELIILGCLLCSCPHGPYSVPLLTHKELLDFTLEMKGFPGRKKALQALAYVKERAGSIMEIFVHMFLGLPNNLGGLGIEGGIFNHEIKLNNAGKNALKQNSCHIDYCFPEVKIGIEYQGGHHQRTMDQDSARTTALEDQGFKIVAVTKTQLYDPAQRAQLFRYILKLFKKRHRIRNTQFEISLRRIIELLPRYPT